MNGLNPINNKIAQNIQNKYRNKTVLISFIFINFYKLYNKALISSDLLLFGGFSNNKADLISDVFNIFITHVGINGDDKTRQ